MVKIETLKEDFLRMEEICIDAALQELKQDPSKELQSTEIVRKKLQSELRGTIQFLAERIAKGFMTLRDVCLQKSLSTPAFIAHLQELNKIHEHSLTVLETWNKAPSHEILSIKEIAGISTKSLDAFFAAAQFLMDEQRFAEAANVLFYLCNLNPNDVNYLLALGSAEYHTGEFLRASAAFDLAQLLDPQNPFSYLYGAHSREHLKQYEEALQLVELSLSLLDNEPSLEDLKPDAKLFRERLKAQVHAERKEV